MASFKPSIPPTSDSSTSDEVHVTMGPMFATALLRRIKLEGNSGRNVAMIKSSKDTRYAIDAVGTHDGEKFLCWALSDLSSFRQNFGGDAYDKTGLVSRPTFSPDASPRFQTHSRVIKVNRNPLIDLKASCDRGHLSGSGQGGESLVTTNVPLKLWRQSIQIVDFNFQMNKKSSSQGCNERYDRTCELR